MDKHPRTVLAVLVGLLAGPFLIYLLMLLASSGATPAFPSASRTVPPSPFSSSPAVPSSDGPLAPATPAPTVSASAAPADPLAEQPVPSVSDAPQSPSPAPSTSVAPPPPPSVSPSPSAQSSAPEQRPAPQSSAPSSTPAASKTPLARPSASRVEPMRDAPVGGWRPPVLTLGALHSLDVPVMASGLPVLVSVAGCTDAPGCAYQNGDLYVWPVASGRVQVTWATAGGGGWLPWSTSVVVR